MIGIEYSIFGPIVTNEKTFKSVFVFIMKVEISDNISEIKIELNKI